MAPKRAEKTTALKITPENKTEWLKHFVESLMKDDPSQETKDWYQARLAGDPDEWRKLGELMREATELALKGHVAGYAAMESVKRGTEILRADLGFEQASTLERLLIDQTVLCYVRLGMIENQYSRQLKGSYQMDVATHWEMRVTLAQQRYLKAITTLAKVRGLLARAELLEARAEAKRRLMAARPVGLMEAVSTVESRAK
jgi:hypothetical protein